jgi:hypothetical protein
MTYLSDRLGSEAHSRWKDIAADLADRVPLAAEAFIETTPAALAHLEPGELETWARQGRRLCRRGWKSAQLAARFFRISPDLLDSIPLRALEQLVDVLARLMQSSEETASICLLDSPALIARLRSRDREPFIAFTRAVCSASWVDTRRCFERGPGLIEALQPEQRSRLLELAATAASRAGPDLFSLFAASAEALATLEPRDQAEAIGFARRLAPLDARAAMESLASAPQLRQRLDLQQAMRWREAGLELLREGQPAERAERYFRIESTLAEEMLAELAGRVELDGVGGLLGLYAKALTGEPVLVKPTGVLVGRKIGWATAAAPTTDGISIFLPPVIELFGDRDSNFQGYKVYTTHQAGRLEFGSFLYRFDVDGEHLPSTALDREGRRLESEKFVPGRQSDQGADHGAPSSRAVTSMQRWMGLFEDRKLASELFALVEDTRIDARVCTHYPGVRRWLRRLHELEATRRPDLLRMALRQAFVENLMRDSLDQPDRIRWPRSLATRLERAVATLRVVKRPGATVQDSAEVAAVLYDLAIAIPNLPPRLVPHDWGELDADAVTGVSGWDRTGLEADHELPRGEEVHYQSPGHPDYRGEFKPELVQLLDRLRPGEVTDEGAAPLTREQILELLESSSEIEFDPAEGGQPGDLEALLANLQSEAADSGGEEDEDQAAPDASDADAAIRWFRYHEWDFRIDGYLPDWCRVGERPAAEGEVDFYREALRLHHGLVVETRRQFERMRPESFRRLKRLEDGHEIDLDQAIEFHADKKAGAGPLARFYSRRNKIKRDVAVAFLLDLSGSTGEEIPPAAGMALTPGGSSSLRTSTSSAGSGKRIIDIERESTVLVVEALEAIGDAYGIYGFSGHGRENVEFHVIKDLDEPFGDPVRRRIDRIEPKRSTRMGPAIRHAIAKLNDHEAKVKILILVSDGRPQDEEYGRGRREKEYAVHDTKRALLEAKRQRITPFLITVDTAGRDYLRNMCDDIGYQLVAEIESLPRRLPRLYRHLAAE